MEKKIRVTLEMTEKQYKSFLADKKASEERSEEEQSEDYDFNPSDWYGGNFDDCYNGGLEDGYNDGVWAVLDCAVEVQEF